MFLLLLTNGYSNLSFTAFGSQSTPDQCQIKFCLPIVHALFFGTLDRVADKKLDGIEFALEKKDISEAI